MLKIANNYRYIIAISIVGFLLTGVLGYPYRINWDSNYTFTKYSIEGLPPTNWMGWFYVYFWDILYKITNTQSSIGVFHNVLYWVSMPIIYINFFEPISEAKKFKNSYNYWYMIVSCCPYIIPFLSGVSNNILVMSVILFGIALYTIHLKTRHKRYICLSFMVLLCASFLRRDSFIIVLPIVVYFGFVLMNRNIIKGILIAILFVGTQSTIDYNVTQKYPLYDKPQNQYAIDTLGLTMFYDLAVMSYLKNELLIPDTILKPEYQSQNNTKVLTKIRSFKFNDIGFFWHPIESLGSFLESGTVWFSGLTIKDVLPIYIANIHWYIFVRGMVVLSYILSFIPVFFASFMAVWYLFKRRDLFSQEKIEFLLVIIVSSWIFSIVIGLSAVSVQLRYLEVSTVLMWIASGYVSSRIFPNFKRQILIK